MGSRFPFTLLVPGVLFVAAGCALLRLASATESEQAARLRREGVMAICLGLVLLAIAVPLGFTIQSLV